MLLQLCFRLGNQRPPYRIARIVPQRSPSAIERFGIAPRIIVAERPVGVTLGQRRSERRQA